MSRHNHLAPHLSTQARATRDHDGDGLAQMDLGAYELPDSAPVLEPVGTLVWNDVSSLSWPAVVGALEYQVYRGSLSMLGYGQFGSCRNDLDPDRTDTVLLDVEEPPTGQGFAYLITAADGLGAESGMGQASCAERSNFAACP